MIRTLAGFLATAALAVAASLAIMLAAGLAAVSLGVL